MNLQDFYGVGILSGDGVDFMSAGGVLAAMVLVVGLSGCALLTGDDQNDRRWIKPTQFGSFSTLTNLI